MPVVSPGAVFLSKFFESLLVKLRYTANKKKKGDKITSEARSFSVTDSSTASQSGDAIFDQHPHLVFVDLD